MEKPGTLGFMKRHDLKMKKDKLQTKKTVFTVYRQRTLSRIHKECL